MLRAGRVRRSSRWTGEALAAGEIKVETRGARLEKTTDPFSLTSSDPNYHRNSGGAFAMAQTASTSDAGEPLPNPRVVIVLSGKRKSGKDFLATVLQKQ